MSKMTSREPEVQVEQKQLSDLEPSDLRGIEARIYQDAYLNVPVRTLAKVYGFGHDETARTAFHKKYQYILDLAHWNHQRDLRAAQWDLAVVKMNPTMLIWLGKQAGQTDIVPTSLGEDAPAVADPTVINIVYPEKPKARLEAEARAAKEQE